MYARQRFSTSHFSHHHVGTTARKIVVGGADQAMPKPRDWPVFLSDDHNKTELIKCIAEYSKGEKFRRKLKIPITITAADNAWLLDSVGVHQLPSCNHHEADTRIILHAVKSEDPVVVVATDTDILVLLMYAFNKYLSTDIPRTVQMQIENEKFVDINEINRKLPEEVRKVLPAYHSVTGCDTTSYPFGVRKAKPLKKAMKNTKMNLLRCFGNEEDDETKSAEKFLQTVMYPGKENESIIQTRSRMYGKQKQKASSSLIPDPSSLREHLKRAKLLALICNQCGEQDIDYPDPTEYGWLKEDGLKPCWFTGPQLPPSLIRERKKGRRKKPDQFYGYEADTEESDVEDPARKKLRRPSPTQSMQVISFILFTLLMVKILNSVLHVRLRGENLVSELTQTFVLPTS